MNAANVNANRLVISYLQLRRSLGYLGLLLPFIVVLAHSLDVGKVEILESLSTYYHTAARNYFVAVLAAIAVLSFSYRGYERKDDIAGDIVALSALGIAFFPVSLNTPGLEPRTWIGIVHNVSAVIFFLALAYFSLVLFPKTDPTRPMTRQKRKRNRIYRLSGCVILLSLIGIAVNELYLREKWVGFQDFKPLFWFEMWALFAFGLVWLTKGEAILEDK